MKKVSTEECKLFLAAHYAQKNIDTHAKDWVLIRKYKNFHNETCRDFRNIKNRFKAMVIAVYKNEEYELIVKENASYKNYIFEMKQNPMFYYVSVITNYGLTWFFERTMRFNALQVLDVGGNRYKKQLMQIISKEFSKKEYVSIDGEMLVLFPLLSDEEVVRRLKTINCEYRPALYEHLSYTPYEIDAHLMCHDYPGDSMLSIEEKVEVVLSIVTKSDRTVEDYARLRNILCRTNREEEYRELVDLLSGFKVDDQIGRFISEAGLKFEINNILYSKR